MYTVKYRKPSQFFWRKIKKVKGDGFASANSRYFILDDETRVEVPSDSIFVFSRGRYEVILKNMEKDASQRVNVQQ